MLGHLLINTPVTDVTDRVSETKIFDRDLLRTLAIKRRRNVIELLIENGPLCIGEITRMTNKKTKQSHVSLVVADLERSGLARKHRTTVEGKCRTIVEVNTSAISSELRQIADLIDKIDADAG